MSAVDYKRTFWALISLSALGRLADIRDRNFAFRRSMSAYRCNADVEGGPAERLLVTRSGLSARQPLGGPRQHRCQIVLGGEVAGALVGGLGGVGHAGGCQRVAVAQ